MRKQHNFVCPSTGQKMTLEIIAEKNNEVLEGSLISPNGDKYSIINGLPYLVYPPQLPEEEKNIINWYNNNYKVYDEYLPLTFKTFKVDENEERMKMINKLNIKPHYKILETGAGTGRDSFLLASKLDKSGELHVHDIFDKILMESFEKLKNVEPKIIHCISNAMYLPYPDNYFDIYYHFGGLNTFSDKKKAFEEISRVVKPGGKVIIGDESMPVWLRKTDFGKILMNSNPHYIYMLPLEDMHYTAREVSINYIIGGAFYFISYSVGEGEPYADFDFEIPGPRGGTHRTRYFGHVEGVSEEAIDLAKQAREKSGKSMHQWLDDVLKNAALNELNN